MDWDISKILEILAKKSKKERATLMDHTFILVGSISTLLYLLTNLHIDKLPELHQVFLASIMPYFMGFALLLGSLPLCKIAVKYFL